jgi:hypothetical protein
MAGLNEYLSRLGAQSDEGEVKEDEEVEERRSSNEEESNEEDELDPEAEEEDKAGVLFHVLGSVTYPGDAVGIEEALPMENSNPPVHQQVNTSETTRVYKLLLLLNQVAVPESHATEVEGMDGVVVTPNWTLAQAADAVNLVYTPHMEQVSLLTEKEFEQLGKAVVSFIMLQTNRIYSSYMSDAEGTLTVKCVRRNPRLTMTNKREKLVKVSQKQYWVRLLIRRKRKIIRAISISGGLHAGRYVIIYGRCHLLHCAIGISVVRLFILFIQVYGML